MSFTLVDQTGYTVNLRDLPKRIVSLVPSQTELLSDLGLNAEVVGVTRYCVHPTHWQHEKTIVGGTKNFDPEIIRRLNPDLILGNKEENAEAAIMQLRAEFPVWLSDIADLPAAFSMIEAVGHLTGTEAPARELIDTIKDAFSKMRKRSPLKVLYVIWKKPWMVAAKGTFIDSMLGIAGFENAASKHQRYPSLSESELRELKPDVVFLSSEPYPFNETHLDAITKIFPDAKAMLVDGEIFSWYGSRLLKAPDYINSLPIQ
jgi:ABC-type Fe3+-hydroxamate transport system substrate-binding protein